MIFPGAETQRENEITENTHYYQMDNSSDQTYFVQNETLYATYKGSIRYPVCFWILRLYVSFFQKASIGGARAAIRNMEKIQKAEHPADFSRRMRRSRPCRIFMPIRRRLILDFFYRDYWPDPGLCYNWQKKSQSVAADY